MNIGVWIDKARRDVMHAEQLVEQAVKDAQLPYRVHVSVALRAIQDAAESLEKANDYLAVECVAANQTTQKKQGRSKSKKDLVRTSKAS